MTDTRSKGSPRVTDGAPGRYVTLPPASILRRFSASWRGRRPLAREL